MLTLTLTDIIERGQAAYMARFDAELMAMVADVAQRQDVEPEPTAPNLTLDEDRQRALCLSCSLPECVDVTDSRCPIRREQRRVWREQQRRPN